MRDGAYVAFSRFLDVRLQRILLLYASYHLDFLISDFFLNQGNHFSTFAVSFHCAKDLPNTINDAFTLHRIRIGWNLSFHLPSRS